MNRDRWLGLAAVSVVVVLSFCGGNAGDPNPSSRAQADSACSCTPTELAADDYRHDSKHVDLVGGTPQEIGVADVLGWPVSNTHTSDAPRSGRELQLFHIAKAYLQSVYVVPGDCDVHMELSAVPNASAPRIIVETPIDASFCAARSATAAGLKAKGLSLTTGTVDSIPVEVTGMAFEDYEHKRGSALVATPWELHPAVVTILP